VFRDPFASFAADPDARCAKELGNFRIVQSSRLISSSIVEAHFLHFIDTARHTQLLRQRSVGPFLKLGLNSEQFAETLLCWRHFGFSVDNSVRLEGGDHTARQALAHCSARAPLSLQQLICNRTGGKVLYNTSLHP